MNLPPNSAPVRSAPDKAAPSFSYDGSPMVFAGSPFARCEEAQNTPECLGVTGNEDRFFCPILCNTAECVIALGFTLGISIELQKFQFQNSGAA